MAAADAGFFEKPPSWSRQGLLPPLRLRAHIALEVQKNVPRPAVVWVERVPRRVPAVDVLWREVTVVVPANVGMKHDKQLGAPLGLTKDVNALTVVDNSNTAVILGFREHFIRHCSCGLADPR